MDLDLYLARSNTATDTNLVNELWLNDGFAHFTKAANALGAAGTLEGFVGGVAVADYDNNGFVDIYLANGDNWWVAGGHGPAQLFRNVGNGNRWLGIELVGLQSNRDGLGARVVVAAGGISQLREQNGGIHHRSQNHDRLHFGLGGNTLANVTVRWPSGNVQTLTDVPSNQMLTVYEKNGAGNGTPPVTPPVTPPGEGVEPVVVAVGESPGNAANIADVRADGTQHLGTAWSNSGTRAKAWFTLDLGASVGVEELRIAPRGDRDFRMDVYVGDTLSDGHVQGDPAATCLTPGTDAKVPTVLVTCALSSPEGRYVTVQSTNRAWFKVHGVEVVAAGAGDDEEPGGDPGGEPGELPGVLAATLGAASGSVNLAQRGNTDWAHWGFTGDVMTRKAGGSVLTNYAPVGTSGGVGFNGSPQPFAWNGGSPTGSASNVRRAIRASQPGRGFELTLPAGTGERTVHMWVGLRLVGARLTATLSDGSAAAYSAVVSNLAGKSGYQATVRYRAASNGQTLTLRWVLETKPGSGGWVSLEAAAVE
jgi:hypothetical protein